MKLSQTREAIVIRILENTTTRGAVDCTWDELISELNTALNDYTQSIIEMVEGKERSDEDCDKIPGHAGISGIYQCDCSGYNQAIEDIKELLTNDTK